MSPEELAKLEKVLQICRAELTQTLREKIESQGRWTGQWWTALGLLRELERDRPRTCFGEPSSEDRPRSVDIVDLRILWITSQAGAQDRQHEYIAIQLVAAHSREETSRSDLRLIESPGGGAGKHHSAALSVEDAFTEYLEAYAKPLAIMIRKWSRRRSAL